MEESGSEGLDKMLMSRQDTQFMQEVEIMFQMIDN